MTLRIAAVLAFVQGAFMLADGVHFLTSGAYFGNGLGPWAAVVAVAGINARTPLMAAIFIVFGAFWLAAAFALARGRLRYGVIALAVLTLWYAPFGTLLSAVIAFLALRAR